MRFVNQAATYWLGKVFGFGSWRSQSPVAALMAWCMIGGVAACENPLSVENPNNFVEDDLDRPTAASAIVNGAQGTVSRTLNGFLATYSAVSDELRGLGSRDAWRSLARGLITEPNNEFTDAHFGFAAEARFVSELAVSTAEDFDQRGELSNRDDLARAYLYAAIIYTYLADVYDDFVLPESPTEAAPAVGNENMVQLYDRALDLLDQGLAVTASTGNIELENRLFAQRARTGYARSVWQQLNPSGSAPANPLISDGEVVSDAQDVLSRVSIESDWRYDFTFTSATVGGGPTSAAFEVNQRGGLGIGTDYAFLEPGNPRAVTGVKLEDPIDRLPDPRLEDKLDEFLGNNEFAPLTVVSARELMLIVAEDRLAQGDTDGFADAINAVRALYGLTPYSGQIPAIEMLVHERRVNLFLQIRRLHDMYRFGNTAPEWLPQSDAYRAPGSFFPIGITEIQSNPLINR